VTYFDLRHAEVCRSFFSSFVSEGCHLKAALARNGQVRLEKNVTCSFVSVEKSKKKKNVVEKITFCWRKEFLMRFVPEIPAL
jgi:hypothetical protein